ncbi:MAG: MarR family transcriptional regulator [Alphaproteobacteria bacterium]|nr:MAG: MarR family transcriptional regulator [Alphaproteobacteria bacterium]
MPMNKPSSTIDEFQLQRFYPYRFSVLSNMMSAHIAECYKSFDITIPEWRVLAVLGEFPHSTATEIATKTAMDKAAITRAVQRLIHADYILRHASQQDGRTSHLNMTAKGRDMYNTIIPMALAYEAHMLEALSEEETQMLDLLLNKIGYHVL